uniref:Uncharacterized protein n=1 Tax=Oryza glumipatula TaxID=40148 RepID=A0A0D9ZWC2_9ORYZ
MVAASILEFGATKDIRPSNQRYGLNTLAPMLADQCFEEWWNRPVRQLAAWPWGSRAHGNSSFEDLPSPRPCRRCDELAATAGSSGLITSEFMLVTARYGKEGDNS